MVLPTHQPHPCFDRRTCGLHSDQLAAAFCATSSSSGTSTWLRHDRHAAVPGTGAATADRHRSDREPRSAPSPRRDEHERASSSDGRLYLKQGANHRTLKTRSNRSIGEVPSLHRTIRTGRRSYMQSTEPRGEVHRFGDWWSWSSDHLYLLLQTAVKHVCCTVRLIVLPFCTSRYQVNRRWILDRCSYLSIRMFPKYLLTLEHSNHIRMDLSQSTGTGMCPFGPRTARPKPGRAPNFSLKSG